MRKILVESFNEEEFKNWCKENNRDVKNKASKIMYLASIGNEDAKECIEKNVNPEDVEYVSETINDKDRQTFKKLIIDVLMLGGATEEQIKNTKEILDSASKDVLNMCLCGLLEVCGDKLVKSIGATLETIKMAKSLKEML